MTLTAFSQKAEGQGHKIVFFKAVLYSKGTQTANRELHNPSTLQGCRQTKPCKGKEPDVAAAAVATGTTRT